MKELSIECSNVTISFRDRKILSIPHLSAYQFDKIGIIGGNGQGKSTLLNIIAGKLQPDSGTVNRQISFNHYQQLSQPDERTDANELDPELFGRLSVPKIGLQHFSGGEETRFKLAQTLSRYEPGLLMDEPTTHLDRQGIDFLIEELRYYYGTLIIVSHDRYFLDALATTIWEVSDGHVTEYSGNYSDYLKQKEQERLEQERAYDQYTKEKNRLKRAAEKKQEQAKKMANVSNKKKNRSIKPDRLSATKSKDSSQKAIQKAAKAIEKRAEQLEEIAGIRQLQKIYFPQSPSIELHNKFPVMGDQICLKRGEKVLLRKTDFQVPLGKTIAITGNNGAGKSTLLKHILNDGEGISLSSKVVFGSYQQMSYKFTENQNILEYLKSRTDYLESTLRAVLNNMGFQPTEIGKDITKLSGGEATRLVLAQLFVQKANVLIIDEPTNFIDIQTIQALEEFIHSYEGTTLLTSHDRYFVNNVADEIWEIKHQTLTSLKR